MVICNRIHGFDVIRGVAVASMIAFHACYDLTVLRSYDLPFFGGLFEDLWRSSISWTFLLLAGRMHSISKNNLRRAGRYLLVAALIFVVTSLVAVDVPISFGIIYCIGASTLCFWALRKAGARFCHWTWACVFGVLFALCLGVPRGVCGFGPLSLELPRAIYDTNLFSWLGFPGPHFASGDYYPLIPFCFMYGIGVVWGYNSKGASHPLWLFNLHSRPFEFLGRHSLLIYVLHQPALLAILALLPSS